jgi:hypothetical protein
MQDVQYHEVARRTDNTAGLHNINPVHLSKDELAHYASLVTYENLPEAWKKEITLRATKQSLSARVRPR